MSITRFLTETFVMMSLFATLMLWFVAGSALQG